MKEAKTRGNKNNTGGDGDGVDGLLHKLITSKLKSSPQDDVTKAVCLANQFKQMSDSLDSKIKAAFACEAFVQFLDPDENDELEVYRERMNWNR